MLVLQKCIFAYFFDDHPTLLDEIKVSRRFCTHLASLQQNNMDVIGPNILTWRWLPASHAGAYRLHSSQLLRGIAASIACRARLLCGCPYCRIQPSPHAHSTPHPHPHQGQNDRAFALVVLTCQSSKSEARSLRPAKLVQHQTQGRCILQPTKCAIFLKSDAK